MSDILGINDNDVSLASSQLATKCRWATFNNTMGSDHVPIIITINARPERQRITAPRWKSADADWNVFCDCINDQINITDVTDDDVDQLNSKIVDIIRSAAEQSIPRTKPSVSRRQKPLPYWNDEIKMAIRNRNRLIDARWIGRWTSTTASNTDASSQPPNESSDQQLVDTGRDSATGWPTKVDLLQFGTRQRRRTKPSLIRHQHRSSTKGTSWNSTRASQKSSLELLLTSAAQQITARSSTDTRTTSNRTTQICSQTTLQSQKCRNISTKSSLSWSWI